MIYWYKPLKSEDIIKVPKEKLTTNLEFQVVSKKISLINENDTRLLRKQSLSKDIMGKLVLQKIISLQNKIKIIVTNESTELQKKKKRKTPESINIKDS